MKTKITKVERIEEAILAPGTYGGTWSGYIITIPLDNGCFRLTTQIGIRGIAEVSVIVNNTGEITIDEP